MSNVVPLLKRSRSYFTIRQAGRAFDVVIVTPNERGAYRTAVARLATRDAAEAFGREEAARCLLPFKAGKRA